MYKVYKADVATFNSASKNLHQDNFYLKLYCPTFFRPIPPEVSFEYRDFYTNWLFSLLRFKLGGVNQHIAALLFDDSKTLVAQAILTRKDLRFSFMGKSDLQVGAVFVPPNLRGNGYAKILLLKLVLRFADTQSLWWLADELNYPSIKVVEASGFNFYSFALREKIMLILGKYVLSK